MSASRPIVTPVPRSAVPALSPRFLPLRGAASADWRGRGERRDRRRRFERLLWLVAAGCAVYLAWVAFDRTRFLSEMERELARESAVTAPTTSPFVPVKPAWPIPGEIDPAPTAAAPASAPAAAPKPFVARLEIPAIGLSTMAVDGTDETTLRRAVGRIPWTSLPGQPGNVGLAGHRDTDFRGLGRLRQGDRVTLRTAGGIYAYEVEWIRVVKPEHGEVLAAGTHPSLTLVTCYPFRYVGPAPLRYVVRAREVERPESTGKA